jgi:hypothetical protein
MGPMKRLLQLCACAGLVFSLVGCNFDLLWSGITGSGYYSISRSTVSNVSGSLSQSTIDLSSLTTSSVVVYETSGSPQLYGKMAITSAASATSVTIKFLTYTASGGTELESTGKTITAGQYLDLETGTVTSAATGTSDFLYNSSMQLVPQNSSTFYTYSK